MYRAYKFRMYPTKSQEEYINKCFYCCRFIFNYYLNNIKTNGYKNAYSCILDYTNNLKYTHTFLQEVDNNMLIKKLYSLEDAIKNSRTRGFNYPKFKSKYKRNSYTISASKTTYLSQNNSNIEVDLNTKRINLPSLNKVKISGYRNLKLIQGKIINATISKEPNGKYYVSVLYNQKDPFIATPMPKTIVGIDLGIKKLLTLSDGTVYDNNKYIEKYEKRIIKCQKELARKTKGSNNYYKCKQKLAVLYAKLANARKYSIHKITKQITDNYDLIVCENLKTKEMIMKKMMSKKLIDASFSEITRQLEYKSKWKGKHFYKIDTYYPSSQICSVCDHIDKKYKDLNERKYICTNCHNEFDRDFNASINIMFQGLKLFMNKELRPLMMKNKI